jgi:thioredoxin 1
MNKINMTELEQKLQSQPCIILDFSSPGCAPCQKISAALPAVLAELPGIDIAAYEVEITVEPALASRFFVLCVPTLIFFKNGQEIGRFNSLPKSGKIKQLLS